MVAIKDNMKRIFHKVQFNKTDHPQCMKSLTKLHERVSFNTLVKYYTLIKRLQFSLGIYN